MDRGSCGAPSCHALAEDIVLGMASEEKDRIFHMRDRMRYMAGNGDADEVCAAAIPCLYRRWCRR